MATTVTDIVAGPKNWEVEVKLIQWDGTDATEEVSTDLSVIYAYAVGPAFGTAAGHTDDDLGLVEIDETLGSDGSITVSSGAITVNRLATDSGDGTLAAQNTVLILYGKS